MQACIHCKFTLHVSGVHRPRTKTVTAASGTGHSNGATAGTSGCVYSILTPDYGRHGRPKYVE